LVLIPKTSIKKNINSFSNRGAGWNLLSDTAKHKLKEWIGAVNYGDFQELVQQGKRKKAYFTGFSAILNGSFISAVMY
jgi:hypothetical protein